CLGSGAGKKGASHWHTYVNAIGPASQSVSFSRYVTGLAAGAGEFGLFAHGHGTIGATVIAANVTVFDLGTE
ncbi:MAG: hypothetical protein ACREJT_03440, partial [Myxococcota bacterium]